MGGGLWSRGGKERKTRLDIARTREQRRTTPEKSCCRTRKRSTCEATPTGLLIAVEATEPCTSKRRTEICVAPGHACGCVKWCPVALLTICFLCCMRLVFSFVSIASSVHQQRGGGGCCQTFFSSSLFPLINGSVQYSGGFLPDIILLTQGYYHWGTRLNTM